VYMDTRYPDTGDEEYTAEESMEDLSSAKEVMAWVKKRIS
jgi:HEPN domain-containing protein